MEQVRIAVIVKVGGQRRNTKERIFDPGLFLRHSELAIWLLHQKSARQAQERQFVRREPNVVFRHHQVRRAIEIEIFEDSAPRKF